MTLVFRLIFGLEKSVSFLAGIIYGMIIEYAAFKYQA